MAAVLQILPILDAGELSTDSILSNHVALICRCIHRFAGRFPGAYRIPNQLPPSKVTSHPSAVNCELGFYDGIIEKIEEQVQLTIRPEVKTHLRLCLASASLYKYVHTVRLGR